MRKISLLLVLVLVFVTLLSGCTQPAAPTTAAPTTAPGETTAAPTTTPPAPAKDKLVIAMSASPSELDGNGKNDSASLQVRMQMYETLVALDESMNIIPAIAESWEYVDETTLVFKIREGVKFHDGTELKASDVAFSLIRGDEMGYVGNNLKVIDFEKSGATGDYEYTMVLKFPFAPVLSALTVGAAGMVSEAYVNAHDLDFLARNPNGTGPYMLKEWFEGDRIELVKFNDYWAETKGVNELVFRFIPEAANRAIEIEVGGVDIAYDMSPNDTLRLQDNPNVQVALGDNLSTTYIGFNYTRENLQDKRVRQAVSWALDLEPIVDAVYFGLGHQGRNLIAPAVWGFSENVPQYGYDPEKAKQLLADAGYADGLTTKIWTSNNQQRMDIAEIMQNQLGAVGINAEVEVIEWGNFLVALQNKELDIYILGISASTGDGDALYNQFHSTSPFSGNTGYYQNAELDALLEQSRLETDPVERAKVLEKVQQFVMEELPWIPVWHGVNATGLGPDVEGFINSPSGTHILKNVHFK